MTQRIGAVFTLAFFLTIPVFCQEAGQIVGTVTDTSEPWFSTSS